MIRSTLIGMTAGMRSLTPIALISRASRKHGLPGDTSAPPILTSRAFLFATVALATGELLGDKLKRAPDRIVAAGLLARLVTGAVVAWRWRHIGSGERLPCWARLASRTSAWGFAEKRYAVSDSPQPASSKMRSPSLALIGSCDRVKEILPRLSE